MIEGTKAQFCIHDQVIISHYKQEIYEEFTPPAYQKYLKQWFDWTAKESDCIDLLAFQGRIRKFKVQRATAIKHIHSFVPTGKYHAINICCYAKPSVKSNFDSNLICN